VYVSFSAHTMTEDELRAILTKARTFNQPHGITGMLLYRDDFFIQALEGEQETVMALYEKIAQDPRHHHILIIHQEPIQNRCFSQWSMGFNHISDAHVEEVEGFSTFLEDTRDMRFFSTQPSRATQLLESFKDHVYF
jgi:hypothetical protein